MNEPNPVTVAMTGTVPPGMDPLVALTLGICQQSTASVPPPARLLPLVSQSPNEAVANMLARLIGDDPRCATSAIIILTGIQAFLDTGDAKATATIWEPLIVARKLKQQWGGQAYRQACKALATCHGPQEANYRLYTDVCQLLVQDPEQEKNVVDASN